MHVVVTFQDRGLAQFAAKLKALGEQGRAVMAVGLNEGIGPVRHQTVAAETAQTGLEENVLERAQKLTEASAGSLAVTIRSQGGDVRLKFFGAQETPGGVQAHPFNQNRTFAHSFMKGGLFPNRVPIAKLNGQVIERVGKARRPTRTVKSGVVIPTEMVKGQTAAAFEAGINVVSQTIVARLGALMP